ncbi:MAG: transporter substrate-binding domain-containing protein [Gammaproteobacteria bacterium]|nr:MAG: transporter substrate-binding domain-containing protein [Gammaproteobacteria bacterium]
MKQHGSCGYLMLSRHTRLGAHTRLLVCMLVGLLFAPLSAAEKLVLNAGSAAPFVRADGNGFYNLLVKELFRRMDMEAEVIALPSERALLNANAGIEDGNIARTRGIEKKYTNLVRVPGKVVDFEFMVFTEKADFPVTGWDSLKPYDVGFITGWKILEKNVTGTRSTTRVRSRKQLFALLDNRRVDIVLHDRWGGLWWLQQHPGNIHYLEPPVATRELFLYLNKKHENLVPLAASTLAAMKQDGEYQRIFDLTLKPLLQSVDY